MIRCSKCGQRAIIRQKYSGMLLCRDHFGADVHRKVRESLRRTSLFGRGARVAVALGGDSKSAALLSILKDLFCRRRDIELTALIIDEEIEGRRMRPAYAMAIAERLDVSYVVESFPPAWRVAEHEPPGDSNAPGTCQVCAAQKRSLLFRMAQEVGADVLATGQSLDDEAGAILLSYLQGDIANLLQLGEHDPLPLIKPLQRIPERELGLYARLHGLLPPESARCPLVSSDRDAARRLLCDFDFRHPGTKYSLLRSRERIGELEP